MKARLISLLTLSLSLNVIWISPTLSQSHFERMPFIPTKATLQAQNQDIEMLIQQGEEFTYTGKPQAAIELYQEILQRAQQQGDQKSEATAYTGLGTNYNRTGQPQLALEHHERALLIFQTIKDRKGEAITLNNIGEVYEEIDQEKKALSRAC